MPFKRNQKENKYITEIDADEIEKNNLRPDPYAEESAPEISPVELPDQPEVKEQEIPAVIDPILNDEPTLDDDPIIRSAPSATAAITTPSVTVMPREPLAEKEIEMVKDFRNNLTGALQIKVARPTNLREAPTIAESLISGQTILLNLKDLPDTEGRRMIDYIAGVLFAIRGTIERPDDRTFLLTPYGVSVATEVNIVE